MKSAQGIFQNTNSQVPKFEFESAGARRMHHPRLEGQSENRDQGKIIGKSKISPPTTPFVSLALVATRRSLVRHLVFR